MLTANPVREWRGEGKGKAPMGSGSWQHMVPRVGMGSAQVPAWVCCWGMDSVGTGHDSSTLPNLGSRMGAPLSNL